MNKYKLYWLDGKIEIIEGYDAVDAFNRAGIGRGALPALDYYEKIDEEETKGVNHENIQN